MGQEASPALDVVERRYAELRDRAATETVRAKLGNLHDVCRHLVMVGKQRLTVPGVVQAYAARFAAKDQSLAESSIRNKRDGANPYHALYRVWESAAEALLVPARSRRAVAATADILAAEDVAGIEDHVTRHRVSLLVAQNRSLKNEVNILKRAREAPVVRISGGGDMEAPAGLPLAGKLTLTEAEVEAIRDFIDPRKLNSRHLRRAEDGAVETKDGRALGDPGLCQALEKIVRSYEG